MHNSERGMCIVDWHLYINLPLGLAVICIVTQSVLFRYELNGKPITDSDCPGGCLFRFICSFYLSKTLFEIMLICFQPSIQGP